MEEAADFVEEIWKPAQKIEASKKTLAGQGTAFIKRFILPKEDFQEMVQTIGKSVHWEDMMLMALIGWATVPSIRWPYQHNPVIKPQTPFRKTAIFVIADHLQQIARIALLVYVVDVIKMLCIGFGFDFCEMSKFPHAFAQVSYTVWITQRIATAKKLLLRKYVSHYP